MSDAQLQTAIQLHRGGQLEAARELYLTLIDKAPGDARIVSLLGQLQLQMGQTETGIATLEQATALAPADQHIALTHARGLAAGGRTDEALTRVTELLATNASDSEAWSVLAALHRHRSDTQAELAALEKALAISPDNVALLISKANALAACHQDLAAIAPLQTALAIAPRNARIHNNLGAIFLRINQHESAVSALRQALELQPDYAMAANNLAIALHRCGRLDAAATAAEHAVHLSPADPEPRAELGSILMSLGQLSAAEGTFESALTVAPDNQRLLAGLAELRERQGRAAEGLNLLRDLIEQGVASVDTTMAAASLARRLNQGDLAIELLGPLLDERGVPMETIDMATRRRLGFLLGDIHDGAARYEQALKSYDRANRLSAQVYDPDAWYRRIDAIITAYRSVTPPVKRLPPPRRLFIVGLPRSGTSLLETMLSRHPAIHALGEQPTVGRLLNATGRYPDDTSEPNQRTYDGLAQQYCDASGDTGGADWVTDKMPLNFLYLGALARMLPNALFVHCRRDPRDVLLSGYFQNFLDPALAFSFSLEHLAHYWRGYQRLMQHWQEQLGTMIFSIDYELLVADPEAVLHSLLDRLDLTWEPAVLSPHLSERDVTTASHAQVRVPIHQRAVRRFDHYRPFLGERAEFFDVLT